MTLVFSYKCLICKSSFESADEKPRCPQCGHGYVEKLSRKGKKTTKKKIKFSGDFVVIGGKKCRKCLHSETATSTTRCTLSSPVTTLHKEKNGWICFSFSPKIKKKEAKNE